MTKHRIITEYVNPPIPDRSHDWGARFDFFDGDDDQPKGWGICEDDAVIDLIVQAAEHEDDGSCMDEVVNLALAGWKASQTQQLEWVKTSERLPQKPGLKPYEYVDCVVLVDGDMRFAPWNCEHECWDDEDYDDFRYEAKKPSHWAEITPPKVSASK